jgi:hypothetical protein
MYAMVCYSNDRLLMYSKINNLYQLDYKQEKAFGFFFFEIVRDEPKTINYLTKSNVFNSLLFQWSSFNVNIIIKPDYKQNNAYGFFFFEIVRDEPQTISHL